MTRARSSRSGFEQRLLKTLRALDVLSGQRLAVGFSGGIDSLALAAALARISRVLDIELLLVHVDHRLRPNSSDDAEACCELARALAVPIEVVALEPGLASRSSGMGIEEGARRERYLALAKTAASWNSSTIVLGHQANDQTETVLMHLFRGAGLDGLAGMRSHERRRIPWWTESASQSWEVVLLRPLLAETRDSIERYLSESGLEPIEDESNASDAFDRNWVRNAILPRVLDRWPAAVETVQRSANALQIDRDDLAEMAEATFVVAARDDRTLRTDTLEDMRRSVVYRVLRRWLQTLSLPEVDLDAVARLHALAVDHDEDRLVEVGMGVSVIWADGALVPFETLCRRSALTLPMRGADGDDDWEILVSRQLRSGDACLAVPAGTNLLVRTIQPGDRWFRSPHSVMEDLRLAGVHPLVRGRLLAVASDDGVLLIPAIYPTIRHAEFDDPVEKVGVRWSRRS